MNIEVLFGGGATLAWLLVIVVTVIIVVRASRGKAVPQGGLFVVIGVIVAILLSAASISAVYIQPGTRGVVLTFSGVRANALEPGLNWIIPFAETVVVYPVSKQTYTMSVAPVEGQVLGDDSIAARTADGQEIYVDASIIYEVNPANVVQVHIEWGNRYQDELVRAQARGTIRDAVSQYRVDEVVSTKRFDMVKKITDAMAKKMDENGLTLVDFVMRNITFSKEYSASVEQKQIAEQLSQQAKFVVEQKRQEAEQARQVAQGRADAVVIDSKGEAQARLIQAEAEAKALEMIAKVIKENPAMLTYQYINKLSPNIQAMLLPSNTPFIYPLPNVGPTLETPTPTP